MRRVTFSALALLVGLAGCTEEPPKTAPKPAEDRSIHVAPLQASVLLKEKKERMVVLDVRTPAEFATGHIAGARNIDFQGADFEKQLRTLDHERSYLVHCAAGANGGRSFQSLKKLQELGFNTLYHLDGGMVAWKRAELPVVK